MKSEFRKTFFSFSLVRPLQAGSRHRVSRVSKTNALIAILSSDLEKCVMPEQNRKIVLDENSE